MLGTPVSPLPLLFFILTAGLVILRKSAGELDDPW